MSLSAFLCYPRSCQSFSCINAYFFFWDRRKILSILYEAFHNVRNLLEDEFAIKVPLWYKSFIHFKILDPPQKKKKKKRERKKEKDGERWKKMDSKSWEVYNQSSLFIRVLRQLPTGQLPSEWLPTRTILHSDNTPPGLLPIRTTPHHVNTHQDNSSPVLVVNHPSGNCRGRDLSWWEVVLVGTGELS